MWALLALAGTVVVPSAAPAAEGNGPAQRGAQIARVIGTAACDDVSQCQVVGIGARACGGPQRYAAWSVAQTDAATLQRLVDQDARATRKELEAAGINSTCEVLPVPGVHCAKPDAPGTSRGRCVLLEGRRGDAGLR